MIHISWSDPVLIDAAGDPVLPNAELSLIFRVTDTVVVSDPVPGFPGHYQLHLELTVTTK